MFLATSRLQPIQYYIQKRRHTIHDIIRDRDVLTERREAERRRGTPSCLFWVGQNMEEPEQREYG